MPWRERDGAEWQMIHLRWKPGRIAVHVAKSHTPETCLPASGHSVQVVSGLGYLAPKSAPNARTAPECIDRNHIWLERCGRRGADRDTRGRVCSLGHEFRRLRIWVAVLGLRLPFCTHSFEERGETSDVFYCLWKDRAREQSFQKTSLTHGNRLDPVLEGIRNVGQRSLEIVVSGYADIAQPKEALQLRPKTLLKVEKPEEKS